MKLRQVRAADSARRVLGGEQQGHAPVIGVGLAGRGGERRSCRSLCTNTLLEKAVTPREVQTVILLPVGGRRESLLRSIGGRASAGRQSALAL